MKHLSGPTLPLKGRETRRRNLRLLLGGCGIFIIVKFLFQIPSGAVVWNSGESDLPEPTYTYRAASPGALLAAAIGFGGLALGFLTFAVSPRAAIRSGRIVPWIIICMGALIMLKRLSQFTGIVLS